MVVRSLDEAGMHVQHLELNEPSLDDVFAEATGYRLEGAASASGLPQAQGAEGGTGKRGRKRGANDSGGEPT